MRQLIIIGLLFISAALLVYAHGGEHGKKNESTDTVTVVGGDTIAINGQPVNRQKNESVTEAKEEEQFELNPIKQIFEHPHNKLVHFPIVIGLIAFGFSIAGRKTKRYSKEVFNLVLSGIIFSLASLITGLNQASPFTGTEKEWLVDYHKNAGILLLLAYAIWALFLSVKKLQKYEWIAGLLVLSLILLTGFLGGVIAH